MCCQVLALPSDVVVVVVAGSVTTQHQSGNPTVGTGVRDNFRSTESALQIQSTFIYLSLASFIHTVSLRDKLAASLYFQYLVC